MSGLTIHEKGILSSGMSDASVAMILGRSLAWVVRRRGASREDANEGTGEDPRGEGARGAAETGEAVSAAPAPAVEAPPAPAPVASDPPPAGTGRRRLTDPATRRRRWFRRFLAAGWSLADLAWLFDADPEQLAGEVWG